ncbi:MAG: hypothetical protein NT062_26635, partial [Proteobacteria bacterium]|nr:hypothetical protein [Pseudomonadota bacterium]
MKLVAALACLVVQVGVVRAEGRGAEAAVRALIDGRQPDDPTQREGVKVLGPDGLEVSGFTGVLIELPSANGADGAPDLRTIAAIDWKLGPLTIATDDAHGVAWFQAPAALEIQFPIGGMNCCAVTATTLRASGIVVRDPKGTSWHVATLALSRQLADVALFRGATEPVPDA